MSKSSSATAKAASQSATKSAAPASTTAATVTAPVVPCEKIAQRAYEKWVSRGCTHGNDMQDWHEAELELKAEMMAKPASKPQVRR